MINKNFKDGFNFKLVFPQQLLKDKIILFLFCEIIFLNAADAFLTYGSVTLGITRELNPTMLYLMTKGWHWFFLMKLGGTFFLLTTFLSIKQRWIQISTLGLINLAYIGLLSWNLYQILLK